MNGLKVLGEIGGLSEAEARKLWVDVRANGALLNSCRAHDFSVPVDAPGSRINVRWACTVCTGRVDSMAKHWYERGRAHGAAHGAGDRRGPLGYPED